MECAVEMRFSLWEARIGSPPEDSYDCHTLLRFTVRFAVRFPVRFPVRFARRDLGNRSLGGINSSLS